MGAAMERPEDEVFIDLPTAARRLGVTRITANGFVLEGWLPARRVGQRWFITVDDLERFAATRSGDSRRGPQRLRPENALPVLEALHDHPGATVQELADLIQRPRRTVLGWIQMLDGEGLVSRKRGSSRDPDRCHLTEAGRRFLHRKEVATTP